MDINRVELKGRIGGDVIYRKTKNGNEWASFFMVTNEYNPKADIDKDKSMATWSSVAIFNTTLVSKLKSRGAKQGSQIWLIGKLYTSEKEKNGHTYLYTNIIVSDFEIIKTKVAKKTEELPNPPQEKEQEDF